MPKAKRSTDSNDILLPLKRKPIAKTSIENLYFKNLAAQRKEQSARRNAKVKRHKTKSLVLCIKCGKDNVIIEDKVMRSADEGSLMACKCLDCAKSFIVS